MKEFLMLFRNEKAADMRSPEQMQASLTAWQNWIGDIAAQGNFVGTNRLYPEGKSLMANGAVIDGPYAETKEFIGGYLMVKCNSLEEAVEMAKGCPGLQYGGSVEVRSVMAMEMNEATKRFMAAQE